MKITIEPDPDNEHDVALFERLGCEQIVYNSVLQFVLGGTLTENGLYPSPFRRIVIGDANMLLGTVAALGADIADQKALALEKAAAARKALADEKNANA